MTDISKILAPLERPTAVLSFMGENGATWSPDRAGRYSECCERGRFYARELLGYIRLGAAPSLLGHIIKMIPTKDWSGVEVGFFQEITERAAGFVCHPAQAVTAEGMA